MGDTVTILYYFTEKDGKVWKVQSIDGGEWEWLETPYESIPYVITEIRTVEEMKLLPKPITEQSLSKEGETYDTN